MKLKKICRISSKADYNKTYTKRSYLISFIANNKVINEKKRCEIFYHMIDLESNHNLIIEAIMATFVYNATRLGYEKAFEHYNLDKKYALAGAKTDKQISAIKNIYKQVKSRIRFAIDHNNIFTI